jgi:hypothetical protein
MPTSRMLAAALAALAFATPALAQQLPVCSRADSDYDTVSIRYHRNAFGGSPVDVTARSAAETRWTGSAMTWTAVYDVGSGNFQIRMGSARQLPFVPTRVTLSRDASASVAISGTDLIEYPRTRDLPREYRMDFGSIRDLGDGEIAVWSAATMGEPIAAQIETANGQTFAGTLRFTEFGVRRMRADSMHSSELNRIRTGACRIG